MFSFSPLETQNKETKGFTYIGRFEVCLKEDNINIINLILLLSFILCNIINCPITSASYVYKCVIDWSTT